MWAKLGSLEPMDAAQVGVPPGCVRVQAEPPNLRRGHACDSILIIMPKSNNYNDRDHNRRLRSQMGAGWPVTKQFTVPPPAKAMDGSPSPLGTSSVELQVNCLGLRSGSRNLGPEPDLNRSQFLPSSCPVQLQFLFSKLHSFVFFVPGIARHRRPQSQTPVPAPLPPLVRLLRRRFHRLIEVISNCKLIAFRPARSIHIHSHIHQLDNSVMSSLRFPRPVPPGLYRFAAGKLAAAAVVVLAFG